jgi:hypothetical protein
MAGNPQVNIRLSQDLFEVLEAAAYVQRVTPATLVAEAAEESIDQYAKEASVQTALEARREADSATAGKLRPIKAQKSSPVRRRSSL